MSKLAVVRVRGDPDLKEEVKDTLKMLNLNRPNYCVIVPDDSSHRGMLLKVKEVVTWGVIESEVLENLLLKRGELEGGENVTDEKVDDFTSYSSVSELAEAVCENDFDLSQLDGLKPVFRLHSPKKGYAFVGRSFSQGGAMGDREKEINDLILRMI